MNPVYSSNPTQLNPTQSNPTLHYVGRVVYSVAGFVDRNNDTLSDEIRNLMISSNNQLVKNIFNTSSVSSSGTLYE